MEEQIVVSLKKTDIASILQFLYKAQVQGDWAAVKKHAEWVTEVEKRLSNPIPLKSDIG